MRSYGYVAAALAALVTVGACASSGGAGKPAPVPRPIVVKDERDAVLSAAIGQRVISDDPTVGDPIAAPAGQVYQALIAVYSDLGSLPRW